MLLASKGSIAKHLMRIAFRVTRNIKKMLQLIALSL